MTDITHLPLELLQTFVKIVESEGDASAAAEALEISQPSISKRLSALRRLVGGDEDRSWLMLKGKRWLLTRDGERVIGTVADLVRHYEQVERFVATEEKGLSTVTIACGQTAASGFVRIAIEKLLKSHPDCRVRLSTLRGRDRITGVAGGQFDMAIVTDSEAVIRDVAGIDLYIEPLSTDHFVIVGNPSPKSEWSKAWEALPDRRPIKANELTNFPFILPEPDSTRRQTVRCMVRSSQQTNSKRHSGSRRLALPPPIRSHWPWRRLHHRASRREHPNQTTPDHPPPRRTRLPPRPNPPHCPQITRTRRTQLW